MDLSKFPFSILYRGKIAKWLGCTIETVFYLKEETRVLFLVRGGTTTQLTSALTCGLIAANYSKN